MKPYHESDAFNDGVIGESSKGRALSNRVMVVPFNSRFPLTSSNYYYERFLVWYL